MKVSFQFSLTTVWTFSLSWCISLSVALSFCVSSLILSSSCVFCFENLSNSLSICNVKCVAVVTQSQIFFIKLPSIIFDKYSQILYYMNIGIFFEGSAICNFQIFTWQRFLIFHFLVNWTRNANLRTEWCPSVPWCRSPAALSVSSAPWFCNLIQTWTSLILGSSSSDHKFSFPVM